MTAQPSMLEHGGRLVGGTEVVLPARARAGDVIKGRAPAGSVIECCGNRWRVADEGGFELYVPWDASGYLPVRIERPHGTPILLHVQVLRN